MLDAPTSLESMMSSAVVRNTETEASELSWTNGGFGIAIVWIVRACTDDNYFWTNLS